MKTFVLCSTLALLVGGFAVAREGDEKREVPSTQPTTQTSDVAVNKNCAVEQTDPVDPEVWTMHDGKKIGFCCKECIETFKKDPEKYLKTMK